MMSRRGWDPVTGVREALRFLAIRAGIILPVWAILALIVTPWTRPLDAHWAIYVAGALLLIAPGVGIGKILSDGLVEAAGMVSVVITFLGAAFAWLAIAGGVLLANLIYPIREWQVAFLIVLTGAWATFWVLKQTLLEQ